MDCCPTAAVTLVLPDGLVSHREYQGRTITHTWVGDADVLPSRVHTVAFTAGGDLLLVGGPGEPGLWLPGGGIEPGESPEEALARELLEEATATVEALRPLGAQRVDDPATGSEYRAFYWWRVTIGDEYAPEHEVAERHLVRPDQFLDALSWGRRDPKAALLLDRALAIERGLADSLRVLTRPLAVAGGGFRQSGEANSPKRRRPQRQRMPPKPPVER